MQHKRRVVQWYLVISGFFGLAMVMHSATYVTFLLSRGLNLFQVNLVNVAFFTTLLLTEVPTGVLADRFGRKKCVVASAGLLTFSMLMYGFAHSFVACVVAEIIAGIGATLNSGAFNAWMYGEMGEVEQSLMARPAIIKKQQIGSMVMIIAAPLGAMLGQRNLAYPWFASATAMGIAMLLAIFFMKETSWQASGGKMHQTMQIGVMTSLNHPVLRFMLLLMTLQLFCVQAPNMQWQPFFQPKLGSIWMLGVLKAGIGATLSVGTLLAPRFLKMIKSERRALVCCQLVVGVLILFTGLIPYLGLGIAAFLLHEVARGAFGPLSETYLNDHVTQESERATILSTVKMGNHFGGILGLLFSGYVALHTSIGSTWAIVGLIMVVGTTLLLKNGKGVKE